MNKFLVLLRKDFFSYFLEWKAILALVMLIITMFFGFYITDAINEKLQDRDIGVDVYEKLENEFGSLNIFIPFILSIIFLPLVILILSYNSISEHRQNNNIRYYLLRVSRIEFLLSKILSVFFLLFFILGVFFLITNIVLVFKFDSSFNFSGFFHPWLYLSIYSLGLASFYTFLSSFLKSSALSLVLGFGGFLFLIFAWSIDLISWLSIFSHVNIGFAESSNKFLSYFKLIIYSFTFFLLSWFNIERSDL